MLLSYAEDVTEEEEEGQVETDDVEPGPVIDTLTPNVSYLSSLFRAGPRNVLTAFNRNINF